ncbi:MAG: hypothetical protein U9R17_04260 [Thermodesulfobacteriota bacterium]|nr:hypothetical protein [Thermodesulfobacteriota bacterium]
MFDNKAEMASSNMETDVLTGEGLVRVFNNASWLEVGKEMGRKFNHNLISRAELIEWLRRARSIMQFKGNRDIENYNTSIRLLREGFMSSHKGYGKGGLIIFNRLAKDAGYPKLGKQCIN